MWQDIAPFLPESAPFLLKKLVYKIALFLFFSPNIPNIFIGLMSGDCGGVSRYRGVLKRSTFLCFKSCTVDHCPAEKWNCLWGPLFQHFCVIYFAQYWCKFLGPCTIYKVKIPHQKHSYTPSRVPPVFHCELKVLFVNFGVYLPPTIHLPSAQKY